MRLTRHFREKFQKILHHYQGQAVGFRCDRISLPQGAIGQREYLTHPGAVGVLAFKTPRQILLVKQYRYPVREFTYEIPAGKLSKKESPLACVRRELEEETGFRAHRLRKLLTYWPTSAFSNEAIHLYLAQGLTATRMDPDEDEFLELIIVSPGRLEAMIRSGHVRDSKTLIAYLVWKNLQETSSIR